MPLQLRKLDLNSLAFSTIAWSCLLGLGCSQQDLSQYRPAGKQVTNSDGGPKGDATKPAAESIATQTPDASNSPESGSDSPLQVVAPEKVDNTEPQVVAAEDVSASALVPVNVVDGANVRSLLSLPSATDANLANPSNAIEPAAAVVVTPRQVEVLVKDKSFRTDQKLSGLRVSFDDLDLLKVLNMEPVTANATELMPDWLKGLNGKRICVRGFMYPTYDTEGIEQFVLARDNQICCFGRDPKIYDLIQVDMKSGKTTNYIPATRSFDVVGTFHVDMKADDDGKPYGLYVIDDAAVIDR